MEEKEKIQVGDLTIRDVLRIKDQCGKYKSCAMCQKENPVLNRLCDAIDIYYTDDEILHYEVEI